MTPCDLPFFTFGTSPDAYKISRYRACTGFQLAVACLVNFHASSPFVIRPEASSQTARAKPVLAFIKPPTASP